MDNQKKNSVNEKIFFEAYRFSFFQATRLLQGLIRKWQKKGKPGLVGFDVVPMQESVRFSTLSSLQFAGSEISKIEKHQRIIVNDNQEIADIQVSFLGLTGQSSAMPVYMTELEIYRLREKDFALSDFYNLFNHRAISLFYRAWSKYRLPFSYEQGKLKDKNTIDPVTGVFHSLLGINGKAQNRRLPFDAEDMIYYAGFFSTPSRSAAALESSLTEILDIPVRVNQFKGEWMDLLDEDRMQLPLFPLDGKNNCLGVDTVIGDEVFTVEGKFELALGPLSLKQFESLQPGTPGQIALQKFTRFFVGDSFHFNLKYLLQDDAITPWQLVERDSYQPRLGLNTWCLTSNIEDATHEITVEVKH